MRVIMAEIEVKSLCMKGCPGIGLCGQFMAIIVQFGMTGVVYVTGRFSADHAIV